MSKMQIPQKLRSEDFKSDQQELVSKLGSLINQPFEEIYNILNGNVDFLNLNRQLVDIDVTLDKNGVLLSAPQIKLTLKGRARGLVVVNAINLNNPSIYPTNCPFISWNTNNNILNVLNVTGLQASSQYRLTLEITA